MAYISPLWKGMHLPSSKFIAALFIVIYRTTYMPNHRVDRDNVLQMHNELTSDHKEQKLQFAETWM